MSHPLLGAVEKTLPAGARRDAYLSLLARRLEALKDVAEGRGSWPHPTRCDRALALRVLKAAPETWDDGDENLVRGFLDRWLRPDEDAEAGAATSLLAAAAAVAALEARPGTLFFLLWEMESMLTSPGDIARIPGATGKGRPHPGGR